MLIADLVADYVAYLGVKKGRARCRGHVSNVRLRIERMLSGASQLEDVTPEWIERRLVELLAEEVTIAGRRQRRSRQTVDAHRRELGTFWRWLIRKRRLATSNPVELVDALEPEDPRRVTRPFSPAEAERFFAVVSRERLALYALWATCGFRPGETRRLLVGHVVSDPVDGTPPYVQVHRSTAKNRRATRQPLHPEALRLLAPLLEGRPLEAPLFRAVADWETFKRDLARVGLPTEATPEGSLSRTSLRKLFATGLARADVPLVLAQKLMRHSTPELTANVYTRFDLTEKAAAVRLLPFLDRDPAA